MSYGTRGGTSRTAGRKATTYLGTFPDGTSFRKRSFEVDGPDAFAGIYQNSAKAWAVAGIAVATARDAEGTLRPIYHHGALPAIGQEAIAVRRLEKA